jgi:hypothetical protein
MRYLTCSILLIIGLSAALAGATMPATSSPPTYQEPLLIQIDKLCRGSIDEGGNANDWNRGGRMRVRYAPGKAPVKASWGGDSVISNSVWQVIGQ